MAKYGKDGVKGHFFIEEEEGDGLGRCTSYNILQEQGWEPVKEKIKKQLFL